MYYFILKHISLKNQNITRMNKYLKMHNLKSFFFLFKIHHWVKNFSIFLPVFAANSLNFFYFNQYIIHFVIFSIASSIVYFFNNIYDYEKDLQNKKLNYSFNIYKKKNYYIYGTISFFLLLIFLSYFNSKISSIIICYIGLSILYNLFLKKIKYIDILTIASFHLIRIYYGSVVFEIEITNYFFIFCLSVFLMIGSNKRLYEIDHDFVNRPYNQIDNKILKFLQLIFGLVSIITFLLYILDTSNNIVFQNIYLSILNLFLLIFIIINYLYIQKNKVQDVVIFIYSNKLNLVLVLLFFSIFSFNL